MLEKVKKLIEQPIIDLGYILDDVVYEKEDGNNFLRVIIDKQGAIDIEDCVKTSHAINPLLDETDYIKESYILDVCSKEKGEEHGQ
jgi:ribosome maturation factor RimP